MCPQRSPLPTQRNTQLTERAGDARMSQQPLPSTSTSTSHAPPAPAQALTIAGSDSGAGAGIQADLKTFAAHGVYGTSVLTAVTAQNTLGVQGFEVLPAPFVAQQLRSVLSDMPPRAAKTGMLATAEIVRTIVDVLAGSPDLPLVVDPVTHAKSGDALLAPDAVETLRDLLLPRCTVITPNLPEASALVGFAVESAADMQRAGEALLRAGARAAIIKGGHAADTDSADDLYVDQQGQTVWLRGARIATRCTHGTGCTFSAALTARLALLLDARRGLPSADDLLAAAHGAKAYLSAAMRAGYEVGGGQSPVHHLFAFDAAAAEVRALGNHADAIHSSTGTRTAAD